MRGFSKAGRERSGLPELALSSGPRTALPCAGGRRKPAFLPVLRHLPAPTARAAPGPSVRPLLNHILSLLLFSRRPTPRAFAAASVPPGRPSPICPHTPGTGDNAWHTDGLEQLFGGEEGRAEGGRAARSGALPSFKRATVSEPGEQSRSSCRCRPCEARFSDLESGHSDGWPRRRVSGKQVRSRTHPGQMSGEPVVAAVGGSCSVGSGKAGERRVPS